MIVLFLCSQLLLQTAAAGKNQGPGWIRIKDILDTRAARITLRDPRNIVIGTVETKQLLLIYATMMAIVEAAEINAELVLVPGKEPNAFATVFKEEQNVIGFSLGMLDMIGMDADAAAGIIGHELAHLKLNHMQERKEAIRNSSTTTFSASATKYTRDNERESDYLGAIWAVEAGYDPAGAVRVHEKLYKLSKKQIGFSASHPSSIERLTILKSLVRRLSR